jgi:SAM-dependent methyltransferase
LQSSTSTKSGSHYLKDSNDLTLKGMDPFTPSNSQMREILGVSMSDADLEAVSHEIKNNPQRVFEIPMARVRIAHARFARKKAAAGIQTVSERSGDLIENAIEHNMKGLVEGHALGRPEKLINVIKSLDLVEYRRHEMKVLSVGPRTEVEIFGLLGAGFHPQNIRGLDLISYSPFVDLGDMHAMPYANNSFDLIILGWVLAYSKNNPKVVEEVIRVARPGATIAIGCEYNPVSSDELEKRGGLLRSDYPRFYHTDDILKLFDGHVESVIYRHDVRPPYRSMVGSVMTVFELNKK